MSDDKIIELADKSPVMNYHWHDRGPAPSGYIRGMALSFSRMYDHLVSGDRDNISHIAALHATDQNIGSMDTDVLAYYRDELINSGAALNNAEDRLISIFAIMTGLGMRESSGRHCVGADTPQSRGEPTSELNAEAGLFQVSFDSIGKNDFRRHLFDAYIGRHDLLNIFGEEVTCKASDWHNHGSSTGALFQDTMKRCPLFAVLYTASFLRVRRRHWGPINTKKSEVTEDCVRLFRNVRTSI